MKPPSSNTCSGLVLKKSQGIENSRHFPPKSGRNDIIHRSASNLPLSTITEVYTNMNNVLQKKGVSIERNLNVEKSESRNASNESRGYLKLNQDSNQLVEARSLKSALDQLAKKASRK